MLRHYLTTAVRGLLRHKLYSFINVAGFSIGLAAAILIVLYVRDQLSDDAWIPGTSHVYRLERASAVPGHGMLHVAQAPFPVVQVVGEKAPGLKAFTHVMPENMTVRAGERSFGGERDRLAGSLLLPASGGSRATRIGSASARSTSWRAARARS